MKYYIALLTLVIFSLSAFAQLNNNIDGKTTVDSIQIKLNAAPGKVLTSQDANGNATWATLPMGGGEWSYSSGSGLTGDLTRNGNVQLSGSKGFGAGNDLSGSPLYPIHVKTTDKPYGVGTFNTNSATSYGIYSSASSAGAWAYGVYGNATGASTVGKYGVYGTATTIGTAPIYGIFGTVIPGNASVWYAGYFSGDVYTTGMYLPSYSALKDEILPTKSALNKLLQIEIVDYKYKLDAYEHMNLPEGNQTGVIAEDFKTLYPELVKYTEQPIPEETQLELFENPPTEVVEFEAVNYTALIPHLVKAIQEQQETIEELKKDLIDQKKEIYLLKTK